MAGIPTIAVLLVSIMLLMLWLTAKMPSQEGVAPPLIVISGHGTVVVYSYRLTPACQGPAHPLRHCALTLPPAHSAPQPALGWRITRPTALGRTRLTSAAPGSPQQRMPTAGCRPPAPPASPTHPPLPPLCRSRAAAGNAPNRVLSPGRRPAPHGGGDAQPQRLAAEPCAAAGRGARQAVQPGQEGLGALHRGCRWPGQ